MSTRTRPPRNGSRRSTRPTRSCRTRSAGRAYDTFGRAGVDGGAGGPGGAGFEGFGGFSDIFDAFFGGGAGAGSARRGRPQPGADLRYDLRITFEEAVQGTEKEIEFTVLAAVRDMRRRRRQAGHRADHLPAVQRARRGPLGPPDDARPDGQRQRLPALSRRGQDRRDAVRHLPRRRPDGAQAHAPGHDPARHRRGPPDPSLERGRGRSARRLAGQPVRRGPRAAPPDADPRRDGALLRRRDHRSPRPRSGRGSRSRRSKATKRSRSRPAPSRTPRSGCGARACRTCAGPASAATST